MRRGIGWGQKPAGPRYVAMLAVFFGIEFIALGVAPNHREDWALENVLVVIGIVVLALFRGRLLLSNASYTLLFVFLSLHEIGAHFTYSEVPYDAWFRSITGGSLNSVLGWERNNYDRLVHFTFGLLMALPVRELAPRVVGGGRVWALVVPLSLMISLSTLYEFIEWGAAIFFGSELGMAYLGTQGDLWDAHKDMALANLGALISLALAAKLWPQGAG